MKEVISTAGLSKAKVLAALYNAARPQGMGFLHYDSTPMTEDQAQEFIDGGGTLYFDYLRGRVMKISLEENETIDIRLYDRDNGNGCAELVIHQLRFNGDVNGEIIQDLHKLGVSDGALEAMRLVNLKTTETRTKGGWVEYTLGADELAEPLRAAVKKTQAK